MTIDAVVARSGVARSTIYRHWPNRDALLVDVFHFCVPTLPEPDPGLPFPEALRAFVRGIVVQFSDPSWARMLPALLVLKAYEPALADIEQLVENDQHRVASELLRLGVESGHLPDDVSTDQMSVHLIGPLVFALLTNLVPLGEQFADEVADMFLTGMAARRGRPAS